MDLVAEVEARIGGIKSPARLVRRVRFDAAGACVERTMLSADHEQYGTVTPVLRVVAAGGLDGNGVLATSEQALTGAACRVTR